MAAKWNPSLWELEAGRKVTGKGIWEWSLGSWKEWNR